MELILINQTKLKIMLTAPDMTHYELFPDQLEQMACTDPHTRAAFRHIFDDAEAQIGFHTAGEKLLVQMFTSKCGGCEIFVTRLLPDDQPKAEEAFGDESPELPLTPGEEALIKRVLSHEDDVPRDADTRKGRSETMSDIESKAFHTARGKDGSLTGAPLWQQVFLSVDTLDTLLSVCARLLTTGYTGVSHAYIDEDRTPAKYHLYLEVPDGIFYSLPEEYAFLKEYGEVSRQKHVQLYLSEHGRLLCRDNAVQILGVL